MSQDDINKDLGHYITHKHKREPFWKKFRSKEREDVQRDIKKDLEAAETNENITTEDKKELEQIEGKIEEVNTVEEKVEDEIDEEREGLLKKFFKKLHFGSKHEPVDPEPEEQPVVEDMPDEEMKEFLKSMHAWITRLDPETQKEFKSSKDFELYTKMLKKHNLIK